VVIEPVGRIFAGELAASTCTVDGGKSPECCSYVVSPAGAWCHRIFLAGAITDVRRFGDITLVRVADPTGTFVLRIYPRQRDLISTLELLEPPVFAASTGIARVRGSGAVVFPESIHAISRVFRDAWILRTAAMTLERLERFSDFLDGLNDDSRCATAHAHYATDRRILRQLAGMVETAIGSIRSELPGGRVSPLDPGSLILAQFTGPGEIPRKELVTAGVRAGLTAPDAGRAIDRLLDEGECYEPRPGYIRRL